MNYPEIMHLLFGWWNWSPLQTAIAVSAFWLLMIIAILAILSGNRLGGES